MTKDRGNVHFDDKGNFCDTPCLDWEGWRDFLPCCYPDDLDISCIRRDGVVVYDGSFGIDCISLPAVIIVGTIEL